MTTLPIGRAGLALSVALALTACVDTSQDTQTASDVFDLQVECARGAGTCDFVADGRTPLRVRLCLVTERRHAAAVAATVRTSSGAWQLADATQRTVATVDLAGTRCPPDEAQPTYVDLTFIPDRTPGLARIDATVGAFSHSADVTLHSTGFDHLELRPAVYDLSAARTIAVTATVIAALGGPPSTGTRVGFTLMNITPATASAVAFPATVEVDAAGTATTTVQTSSDITSLVLRATARALPVDGVAPPEKFDDLTLRDLP